MAVLGAFFSFALVIIAMHVSDFESAHVSVEPSGLSAVQSDGGSGRIASSF